MAGRLPALRGQAEGAGMTALPRGGAAEVSASAGGGGPLGLTIATRGGATARQADQQRALREIERHGWALISGVGAGGHHATYTVGLTAQFLPELVVYGLDEPAAAALLNAVAAKMVEDGELNAGDRLVDVLTGGRGVAVIELDPVDAADLAMVHSIYGTVLSARQVVWPDDNGRFPWQTGNSAHPQRLSGEPPF